MGVPVVTARRPVVPDSIRRRGGFAGRNMKVSIWCQCNKRDVPHRLVTPPTERG